MNEQLTNEPMEQPSQSAVQDMPVDLTMEEFVQFQLVFNKKFGRLKMQIPTAVMFTLYILFFLVMSARLWAESGQFPWTMVIIAFLFAASMAATMVMLPRTVRKAAENTYRVCDKNGYYGEWSISPTAVSKNAGETTDTYPLGERTVYFETADCMVFMTQGEQKLIMLPARCMTEEAAKCVRDIVFSPACRVQRRVIARMTAKAETPIERRPLYKEPPTLYTLDMVYEEKELQKLCADQAWRRFGTNAPMLVSLSLFLGSAIALGFESVRAGLTAIPALILFFLLMTLWSGRRHAKAIHRTGNQRLILTVNEQYLTFRQPPAAPITVMWKHVDRAVETPDSVEFYYGGNFMRVPKRAVDDMDAFRKIVDDCMKK